MKKRFRDSGFISLLVLLVLTFLFFAGSKCYFQTYSVQKQAKYLGAKNQAVYLAESGVEWALAMLSTNSSWRGGELSLNCGIAEISVKEEDTGFEIISEAAYYPAVEKIRVFVLVDDTGKFRWVYYEELYD